MLLVFVYLVKGKRLKSVAVTTPGIKCLWALCTLGVVAAIANGNGVGAAIAVLLAVYFFTGAFARSVMTRMLFDKIIEVSCAASIFSFIIALIQYVTYQGDLDRASSVFINANYYAAVIEIVVLFAVYKLFRPGNRKQRAFYAAVIAINAGGLYFTGCRTAVFVLFAAVSLIILLNHRIKALAVFSGSCILFAALIVTMPEILPRMAQLGDDMGTRIAIWRRALEDILKHPVFGEGALAYPGFHYVIGGMRIVHTHNIYLEPILSFGIVGTGLILIYLKKNLSPILKMRNVKCDRDRFVLAVGVFVSVALHGMVDLTAFGVQTGILLLLALAVAGIQENPQPMLVRPAVTQLACLQKTGSTQSCSAVYVHNVKLPLKKSA